MFGQKLQKRLKRQAREKELSKKCACGNYCGPDGLCNACRAIVEKGVGSGSVALSRHVALAGVEVLPHGLPCSKADTVRAAIHRHCPEGVGEDVIGYLVDTATALLEDGNASPSATCQELESTFLPLLEEFEVSPVAARTLCEKVLAAAFPTASSTAPRREAKEYDHVNNAKAVDGELLCRVENLILMYGGSPVPLLKDAVLEIARGHRYGVVGTNGSGKTTLMTRIAKKDLFGFPEWISVVHLRHDQILEGVVSTTTAREYAQLQVNGAAAQVLLDVGFDTEMLDKAVVALSGGWQMRLALACATARGANLLLLDEPTNHLDVAAVGWLVDFINGTHVSRDMGVTAMIVSHDAEFLDQVCTDMIHFSPDGKLAYHPGNFTTFQLHELNGESAKAQEFLETSSSGPLGLVPPNEDSMTFPTPGKVGNASLSRKVPIVSLQNASFQYSDTHSPVLREIDVELTLSSRVAIVGSNGSGKSTLLSLIAGRMKPASTEGTSSAELWCAKGARLAYVAQHTVAHLGKFLTMTPLEYMQLRFRRGFDMETPSLELPASSKGEADYLKRLGIQHGKRGKQVEALLSKIECPEDEESLYEVKWMNLGHIENTFEKLGKLKQLGVESMAAALDEKLWYAWGGSEPRPLTTQEIVQHLKPFGLSEQLICERKISMLSSGQQCRLAFGGALWMRPHILCLDEPTNYLDMETVELLSHAIHNFRGGCAVVTHSRHFLEKVCTEVWEVKDGRVITQGDVESGGADKEARAKAKTKGRGSSSKR